LVVVYRGVIVVLINRNSIRSAGALGMFLVAASSANANWVGPQKASAKQPMSVEAGQRLLADRNARFIENKGQWDARARFLAKTNGLDVWFTDHGIRYDQHFGKGGKFAGQSVDMTFVGGHSFATEGRDKLASRMDMFHGGKSVRGINAYGQVYSKNVVDGVDLRGYFDAGQPRYDLIVSPGTKTQAIRLAFKGANGLSVRNGSLQIGTKGGGFVNGAPVAYQMVDGKRKTVTAQWQVLDTRTAGFKVGSYDASKPLVIDPLVFGTYYGGEDGPDEVRAAIGDGTSTIIVGSAASPDFPAIYGPYNDSFNPAARDAFVARVNSSGSVQDYSALIGGRGNDVAQYVKVDADGSVWVAGTTSSDGTNPSDFPQSAVIGGSTANTSFFVIRFARNDNTVFNPILNLRSVLFGLDDNAKELTGFDVRPGVGGVIRFALTGVTNNALPIGVVPNAGNVSGRDEGHFFEGHRTGFLVRFAFDSAAGLFGTFPAACQYIEGTRTNEVRGVALDEDDNAYIVGTLYKGVPLNIDTGAPGNSSFFETTANVFKGPNNNYVTGRVQRATDIFIRRYSSAGNFRNDGTVDSSSEGFSGLLGGNGDDEAGGIATTPDLQRVYTGSAIALGPNRDVYVTGTIVSSNNYPTTPGAFQSILTDAANVIVTKVDGNGAGILFSTGLAVTSRIYPLGSQPGNFYAPWEPTTVNPAGIAVDARGYAIVSGNLRPNQIAFPSPTPGDPNEPSGMTLSSIWLPSNDAGFAQYRVADRTYESPATPEYPTTEAFLTVLTPTLGDLQLTTYIGGILDDFAFAPSIDPSTGNPIAVGWTDGFRYYARSNAAGTSTKEYLPNGRPGKLPDGTDPLKTDNLVTLPRVKTNPNTRGSAGTDNYGYGFWGTSGVNTPTVIPRANPFLPGVLYGRDGYVIKFNSEQPLPSRIANFTINPTVVDSDGAAVGTVTLTSPAVADTKVYISTDSDKAILSGLAGNDPIKGPYVVIPAGQDTATFNVRAAVVSVQTVVNFTVRTAQVGDIASATLTINVASLDFGISLSPTSVLGSPTGANTVVGTISLQNPATADRTFTLTSSDPTIVPVPSTVTVPLGQTSVSFDLHPLGVTTPTSVTITANYGGVVKQAVLEVRPVQIISLVSRQKTVRGGTGQINLTAFLEAETSVVNGPLTLTTNLPSAFPAGTFTLQRTGEFAGLWTRTYQVPAGVSSFPLFPALMTKRISRSQNVTLTAYYGGTSAATTVTITR
jgi:hypothetical protein